MNYKVEVIKSQRKSLVLSVKNGVVIVKAPLRYPDQKIIDLLRLKEKWIDKRLGEYESIKTIEKYSPVRLKRIKENTTLLVNDLAFYYAEKIGVEFNKITVKKQRSVWGSCSLKRNLNFNLLLSEMPKEVAEYVVIHELCHLKEMNHSKKFWGLVERFCPDYKKRKRWLKEEGRILLNKI